MKHCLSWHGHACHGTVVQAQTLYPDLIYFRDEENDSLVVGQYIPSRLKYRHGNADICIEQTMDMHSILLLPKYVGMRMNTEKRVK